MYVLLNNNNEILIEETDLLTDSKIYFFASFKSLDSINSYRNKSAKIKSFWIKVPYPHYHWVKKRDLFQ